MVGETQVALGWSRTYEQGEGGYGAADVALVVETAQCNRGKDMRSLLTPLNQHMTRRNMSES